MKDRIRNETIPQRIENRKPMAVNIVKKWRNNLHGMVTYKEWYKETEKKKK